MKKATDAQALADAEVTIRQLVWLPGAGLNNHMVPPALEELMTLLQGEARPPIAVDLPALETFAATEDAGVDGFCAALADTPGYIIQIETPKRKWFSDGSPRLNWGETWTEWFYVREPGDFLKTALRFAEDCMERDDMLYPRIFENVAVETE